MLRPDRGASVRSAEGNRMQDLSQGSIRRHLLMMAAPIAIGMLLQTLYFLVDLYFVGRLGARRAGRADRPPRPRNHRLGIWCVVTPT